MSDMTDAERQFADALEASHLEWFASQWHDKPPDTIGKWIRDRDDLVMEIDDGGDCRIDGIVVRWKELDNQPGDLWLKLPEVPK